MPDGRRRTSSASSSGLQIAELPARDTPFAGKHVRDTRLRQQTGLSVVGLLGARQAAARVPGHRDSARQRARRRRHGAADCRAQRAAAAAATTRRRRCWSSAPARSGRRRRGRSSGRALRVHADRPDGGGARAAGGRGRRRRSPATPRIGVLLERAGILEAALGRAHDQRRCDEHLPGGVSAGG